MGRKARREREEAELAYENRIVGTLLAHSSQKKKKPEELTYENISFGAINTYRSEWVNSPKTWTNRLKTKNKDKLRVDLIRYVFGVYKCPNFLEKVWLPEPHANQRTYRQVNEDTREKQGLFISFIPWYLAVAQGKSLYKECTKDTLSRKETHAFLIAPNDFNVKQNIWWARAYCESNNNVGVAGRIARSKLADMAYNNEFWISVMRFFVRFPTNIPEMNDLIDYFVYTRRENENYSLKGRSLDAVRKNCEEWHRFLNKQKSIGGGTWIGSPIEDWAFSQGKDEKQVYWKMTQIKTGNDLLKEGQAMRHCVSSYKHQCMSGETFIWSLSSKDAMGTTKRNLTIQMNSRNEIVQYRGLANRMPRSNEEFILRKWCGENGVTIRKNSYW